MALHWVIPGLFGATGNAAGATAPVHRFPLLERLVARADRSPGPVDSECVLFDLLGVPNEPGLRATAPFCYLADTGRTPDTWIAHADPVHLRADQDRLLLFAGRTLNVRDAEARHLIDLLNTHFGENGLRFEAPSPDRWYVHAQRAPNIRLTSLNEVSGRNVDTYLPQGADQRIWRQYQNEIQMLFHDSQLNQARESRGCPSLNGVWFSGGGIMPRQFESRISTASGASPLLSGLCALMEVPYRENYEFPVDLATGNHLLLDMEPQHAIVNADGGAWRTALDRTERLLNAHGPISKVRIYTCDGRVFDYRSRMRFRIWRNAKPLPSWLVKTPV